MRKALAVGRKELRQILRDRRTLMILLFIPVFFLLLFGYALNFDIRHVRLAVEDRDRTPESRRLVSAFVNSGYFDLAAYVTSEQEMVDLMDRSRIRAALVIPSGLSRDVQSGRPAQVEVIINGDNANTAATVMAYASTIIATESARYVPATFVRADAGPPVRLEPRVWYNPQLRSTLFLVPGLLAYIAMITAVVSTALSVVREKERGTMEQVRMAPIGTLPFIMGKSLPYFVISMLSSLGVLFASMVMFDLPVRGSWLLLLLSLSLFLLGALGMGLLISTIADSQQVAFQAALLSSFLPTIMLSGFIFPIAGMPQALQVVTYVVPARYFLVALRAVVLKGVGLEVIGPSVAALGIFAMVVIGLAAVRLRKEWS
jgi:ABC-2 type transport system permease protein